MNNIYNKLLPFALGAIVTYLVVKILFASIVHAGYTDLNRIINRQRSYPLRSSAVLDQIAYCRAKYLVENNLWTHDGYQNCFNKYGIRRNFSEILAQGYYDDNLVTQAWMNSPSHKNTILGRWKNIGSSKYGNIIVVTFN